MRANRLTSLIPVAERSVTAVSRSTLTRPASAPPPSGNAGSTDYGPRGCTVGPRTCAPAHHPMYVQQQFRIFTHRHTPESLPTVHCSRGSDPPAEALCGSRIWGCGRKSWLLCCGPQDGGGLGRQPRPNPLGPLAEAWLAQREVCRRAMAGVTREIRIRRAGRGESDLASCAGAPPASQAVPRAPGLSSRWPTRQPRRAPTAH